MNIKEITEYNIDKLTSSSNENKIGLISILNEFISYLNTPISNEMVSGDFLTLNDYYRRDDRINNLLIEYSDLFKDENFIDNYLTFKNIIKSSLEDKDSNVFYEINTLEEWITNIKVRIDYSTIILQGIKEYFENIKRLLIIFKISDRLKEKNDKSVDGMLLTRSSEDILKINHLTSIDNKLEYQEYKKNEMDNIKIDLQLRLS